MGKRLGLSAALSGVCIVLSCRVDSGKDFSFGASGAAGDRGVSGGAGLTNDDKGGSGASGGSAKGSAGTPAVTGQGGSGAGGGNDRTMGGAPNGGTLGTAGGIGGNVSSQGGHDAGIVLATMGGASAGAHGESAGGTAMSGGSGKASGGTATSASGGNATGETASSGGRATGGTISAGGRLGAGGTTATGGSAAMEPPSCNGLSAQCQGELCCATISVPGGTFKMGRSMVPTDPDYDGPVQDDDTPEHPATVGPFKLDKYEVTVGRFRNFHASYREWHVANANPLTNAGLHPLAGRTGWGQSWELAATDLPADEAALAASLKCDAAQQTWTDTASSPTAAAESYPINCVTWYVAFAFCIWDGGRLPTEAEWEYVAAGGQANFLYPWGAAPVDNSRANWAASDNTPFLVVGSKPSGAGSLGHLDLSGSMREWVFDWYGRPFYGPFATPTSCVNCVNFYFGAGVENRSNRGGSWITDSRSSVRAAYREGESPPSSSSSTLGLRCARN